MKKCRGCGIELQNEYPDKPGYVDDLNRDYCQRCFRLTHYGDTKYLKTNFVTNEKIFDIYSKYKNELFFVIIDVLDALTLKQDDLLETFKNYNIVLVINKTDLLPANINYAKIEQIFSKILFDLNAKYPNIKGCILSNKFENKFNENFFNMLNEFNVQKIVFAGRANAGKSTLINKLICSNTITTSLYPGTTLEDIEIDFRGFIFVDTPGLVDKNNYSTYLNAEKYKLAKIDKTIKPQVFQFYEPQSYLYEGLLRVDIKPFKNGSITFYINNNNEIHRTKHDNADNYYEKHYNEFKLRVKPLSKTCFHITDQETFVIKGLGLFKVNGECDIQIYSLSDVQLYYTEVSL